MKTTELNENDIYLNLPHPGEQDSVMNYSITSKKDQTLHFTINACPFQDELEHLRKQSHIWRKVCQYERKKWEKLKGLGMIKPRSDLDEYLQCVEQLCGDK